MWIDRIYQECFRILDNIRSLEQAYAQENSRKHSGQDFGMNNYQSVLYKNMCLNGYSMSYKGAAGKAFSLHIPVLLHFSGLSE